MHGRLAFGPFVAASLVLLGCAASPSAEPAAEPGSQSGGHPEPVVETYAAQVVGDASADSARACELSVVSTPGIGVCRLALRCGDTRVFDSMMHCEGPAERVTQLSALSGQSSVSLASGRGRLMKGGRTLVLSVDVSSRKMAPYTGHLGMIQR